MRKVEVFLLSIMLLFSLTFSTVNAGSLDPQENLDQFGQQIPAFQNQIGDDAGGKLASTIGLVVRAFLSLLGIIFVILFIYGGFIWMKSAGNEDDIGRAKRILGAAIIGLVITLLSAAIYVWVRSAIYFGSGVSPF
ncbi:MAG: hypothetical protein COT81_04395 [Candidatus Buchananbacteria bacterium CG10_big_fil_rev_8_21_14_0_10_42_9]|uniref:Uncharacterized protein n=1 Tax=Candidatus Buchananbacteria bacterium CG10_big_fil_rev_8_21_14_0_10_42_9 TaxID=1974526 RepID=A0A2H0W0M2_9BACT|nr:MAG: hypothetical protein COT81_04395 [Candidatus Buchananbacteria bacterium CG10_big_fil_rev_8_21_14_0_10_42_9]